MGSQAHAGARDDQMTGLSRGSTPADLPSQSHSAAAPPSRSCLTRPPRTQSLTGPRTCGAYHFGQQVASLLGAGQVRRRLRERWDSDIPHRSLPPPHWLQAAPAAWAPSPWVLAAPATRSSLFSIPSLGPPPGLAPRRSEKWGARSQLRARRARPWETTEGTPESTNHSSDRLPHHPPPARRSVSFLRILGLCSDSAQTRSRYFFKQKQLDFNPRSFAFAPRKQWAGTGGAGSGREGGRESGGGGLHLPSATAGPGCHCASHIWPSRAAATTPSSPAPGARAPQPARWRAHRSAGLRLGERRTRYSLYLGSCPYMAMCASARRAAAPYKGTRRAPG